VTELPEPLVPPACDCRDLDGFMLNVERLMASELVALSTHEEIAAALFLWCRAWKQHPAASLPDDDKVLASFARLPLARFKKIKGAALRGFVRCSDGRLYHRVLAAEAINAFEHLAAIRLARVQTGILPPSVPCEESTGQRTNHRARPGAGQTMNLRHLFWKLSNDRSCSRNWHALSPVRRRAFS
jgi:hypothetical protein